MNLYIKYWRVTTCMQWISLILTHSQHGHYSAHLSECGPKVNSCEENWEWMSGNSKKVRWVFYLSFIFFQKHRIVRRICFHNLSSYSRQEGVGFILIITSGYSYFCGKTCCWLFFCHMWCVCYVQLVLVIVEVTRVP